MKKITLAIGDGANDVNMIQEAHIGDLSYLLFIYMLFFLHDDNNKTGCGIFGNEGM